MRSNPTMACVGNRQYIARHRRDDGAYVAKLSAQSAQLVGTGASPKDATAALAAQLRDLAQRVERLEADEAAVIATLAALRRP